MFDIRESPQRMHIQLSRYFDIILVHNPLTNWKIRITGRNLSWDDYKCIRPLVITLFNHQWFSSFRIVQNRLLLLVICAILLIVIILAIYFIVKRKSWRQLLLEDSRVISAIFFVFVYLIRADRIENKLHVKCWHQRY